MERALNALEDDTFGAIVQHMRDAPSDPTAPRPQKETSGSGQGVQWLRTRGSILVVSSLQSMCATVADYMFS